MVSEWRALDVVGVPWGLYVALVGLAVWGLASLLASAATAALRLVRWLVLWAQYRAGQRAAAAAAAAGGDPVESPGFVRWARAQGGWDPYEDGRRDGYREGYEDAVHGLGLDRGAD